MSKIPVWKHFFIGIPAFIFMGLSIEAFQYAVEQVWLLPQARTVCIKQLGQGTEASVLYSHSRRSPDMPKAVSCWNNGKSETFKINFFSKYWLLDTVCLVLYYISSVAVVGPGFYIIYRYFWGKKDFWTTDTSTSEPNMVTDGKEGIKK